jgi:hypothetical protein
MINFVKKAIFRGGKKTEVREMTPEEEKRLDHAFAKMNEAFAKMDEAFAELRKL